MPLVFFEGNNNATARTWQERPEGSGPGCWLHGPQLRLRPGDGRADAIQLIRDAAERGVTFFDTAEAYGPFTNEQIVGQALAPIRDQVVIATKSGFQFEGNTQTGLKQSTGEHQGSRQCLAPKRLGIETIDLFYQHRVDPNVPIEDAAGSRI